MSKTIYIGGKITGTDLAETEVKFINKEMKLLAQGHKVHNPFRIAAALEIQDEPWEHIMKECLHHLIESEELHLMPCWQGSKGATLERNVALALGITVVYQ